MDTPIRLPEYKGYTVDFRLKEFRKVPESHELGIIEFIRFDTEKGDQLLEELIQGKGERDLKLKALDAYAEMMSTGQRYKG